MSISHNSASITDAVTTGGATVRPLDYHGWPNSFLLANGQVEAVVVPAIGRIMQLRLCGDDEGVLWENRRLDGVLAAETTSTWKNFGGEKTWPGPQSEWQNITGRAWPPPASFDCAACEASVEGAQMILTSPVEPSYGVQAVRHISLDGRRPRLVVRTTYRKVVGAPVKVGIWVVAQMRDAERMFLLLPRDGEPGAGLESLMGPPPKDLRKDGRLLSLCRDPDHNVKLASAGASVLWVGEDCVARMDHFSPRGGESRVAIYTNRDPLAYVELETEALPSPMVVGDTTERTTAYTLQRRSCDDVFAEAREAFGLAAPSTGGMG